VNTLNQQTRHILVGLNMFHHSRIRSYNLKITVRIWSARSIHRWTFFGYHFCSQEYSINFFRFPNTTSPLWNLENKILSKIQIQISKQCLNKTSMWKFCSVAKLLHKNSQNQRNFERNMDKYKKIDCLIKQKWIIANSHQILTKKNQKFLFLFFLVKYLSAGVLQNRLQLWKKHLGLAMTSTRRLTLPWENVLKRGLSEHILLKKEFARRLLKTTS